MSIKIESGIKRRPQKTVIYGIEGAGKTTLAAALSRPIFLDVERGSDHIDLDRIVCDSMGDVREAIAHLKSTPDLPYDTVVVDSVDWLERYLIQELVRDDADAKTSIEEVMGGFGKGYIRLAEEMGHVLTLLDKLRLAKNLQVVLLGHSKILKFDGPDQPAAFDRYELKLEKKTGPIVKEWCDALLFLGFQDKSVTDAKTKKVKGASENARVLHTEHHAARDAKNRHGLPARIKFGTPAEGVAALAPIFNPGATPATKPAPAAKPAAPAPETKPSTDGDHGDATPAERAPEAKAHALLSLADHLGEDHLTAFLLNRGIIKDGETWTSAPADYTNRVIGAPDAFIGAVQAFTKGAA
jgi:hypothetical protein